MYRIRFHGRGGQGMKTAGRILGTAFFESGFEVQDAPRYGAERRGAPMVAYVRAARSVIHERGVVACPDLVVVADSTLMGSPAAGVASGLGPRTVLLIAGEEEPAVWRERLPQVGSVLALPMGVEDRDDLRFVGAGCAAAAARLVGEIDRSKLEEAIRKELADLGPDVVEQSLLAAQSAWEAFQSLEGHVDEGPDAVVDVLERPDWVDVPNDPVSLAAPDIHAAGTSVQVRTGLWRTVRPEIDPERCHHCTWICSTLCPDSAILVDEAGAPRIDLDHCKGCMVCAAVCPSHAIATVPEPREAARLEERS